MLSAFHCMSMNPTYNKRGARYCVHLFLFVGESIKYEEISLFGRVINSTYKQWSIVLRFDDKQERTVQREGVFFHLNRHAHLHNIHLGVGSSLTAVFINFDMGFLFHVGNSDIAVSDTGQVCTSIKKLLQAECFAGVIQVKFGSAKICWRVCSSSSEEREAPSAGRTKFIV